MKISRSWNFRSIAGKIMMGLVLVAMVGSINVAPAFGDNDHKRRGKHDNRRYEQRGHGQDRGHYVYERGRRVYRPYNYGYRERVYLPPPVVYAPPEPPGIRIFFPPIFIHP